MRPAIGSSPRVRGKRFVSTSTWNRRRLIPARAGKTGRSPTSITGHSAHPRACGENAATGLVEDAETGSSPRVRGKRELGCGGGLAERLIPARAGKTFSVSRLCRRRRAHPRACGENPVSLFLVGGGWGSSPRVRGKLHPARPLQRRRGLIPARAGKTGVDATARVRDRAHPRACGENEPGKWQATMTTGSSPRVRGKHGPAGEAHLGSGLIPARAGKTQARRAESSSSRAHPRACGENTS